MKSGVSSILGIDLINISIPTDIEQEGLQGYKDIEVRLQRDIPCEMVALALYFDSRIGYRSIFKWTCSYDIN